MRPRPKILLITRNLPPLIGGMERLNWHMAEELACLAEMRVVGPPGSAAMAPAGVMVDEAMLKPLPRFLIDAAAKARRIARNWRPTIVLAGSGLTAPLALAAARRCGAKSAAYVHGLDISVRHPLYRALWLPAIRRIDCVIANSGPTRRLAMDAGVAADRIHIVHPGVDSPKGTADPAAITRFRKQHSMNDGPLLLSVGRLSERKGLREFVRDVLPAIVATRSDVRLLVVGAAPNQALHAQSQSAESIRALADAKGVGENIRFLGLVSDSELAVAYGATDAHVFPIRDIPGDPEGFGMVAIEAASHGLPTVAYATGGVVDAVCGGQSGRLVAAGNSMAMTDAVLATLVERDSLRASSIAFAERFAWPHFGKGVANALGLALRPN